MKHKKEIIESLRASLSIMASFNEPPDIVAEKFANWFNRASEILEGAGMNDELTLWQRALNGIRFSDDESLPFAISMVESTLLAILNRLELADVVNAPYLQKVDIKNSYKMSELYVILHCYENSVRRFIEKIFVEKFGEGWWEKVSNTPQRNEVNQRIDKEKKKKWISPRGDSSPLYYLNWGDLGNLIRKHEDIFLPYIGSLSFVESRFSELEGLRNIVAHNGVLPSDDDFQRVIISFRDWCRQIGS